MGTALGRCIAELHIGKQGPEHDRLTFVACARISVHPDTPGISYFSQTRKYSFRNRTVNSPVFYNERTSPAHNRVWLNQHFEEESRIEGTLTL